MRHALFKHIVLCGASFGTVDIALAVGPSARTTCYHIVQEHFSETHGFLARVGFWLQLIFGGRLGHDVSAREIYISASVPPNRHKARLRRRNLPLPRRPDALAHHFLRRYGYVRFRNWIYNRTLTPRIAWCFRHWNWLWAPRESFAACADEPRITPNCSAPLHPD